MLLTLVAPYGGIVWGREKMWARAILPKALTSGELSASHRIFACRGEPVDKRRQTAVRWEPLEGIPETSCADIEIASRRQGVLQLALLYSEIRGNLDRDLVLDFSEVLAFRETWDGDGPRLREECEVPYCRAPNPFVWPLIEVINSRWLASDDFSVSRFLAENGSHAKWRHFSIGSLERTVDVLARGEIVASWRESDAVEDSRKLSSDFRI